MIASSPSLGGPGLAAANLKFYESLWSQSHLVRPERFNTWPLIRRLLPTAAMRLEVGAGLRPRLPIAGTHFVDISPAAIGRLNGGGGRAVCGEIPFLPFADRQFDLVAAFDVIEHVMDDGLAFAELSRVLKDGGLLIFSVPLHPRLWTEFDDCVGHARRYDREELLALMARNRLTVEQSAGFGMMPHNTHLMKWSMHWLTHHRETAMRWYNQVFMPLGMFFQKRLRFTAGMTNTAERPEIILVCRRQASEGAG